MEYTWYRIELPKTDAENFETDVVINSETVRLKFMRVEAPLFSDRKWRCWATLPSGEVRQVSLFTASWKEYKDYGFITERIIKFPEPSDINDAFLMYIGFPLEEVV